MPDVYRKRLPTIDPATVAWWRAPSLVAHAYTPDHAGTKSLCGKATRAASTDLLPPIDDMPKLCGICRQLLAEKQQPSPEVRTAMTAAQLTAAIQREARDAVWCGTAGDAAGAAAALQRLDEHTRAMEALARHEG